jgi:S-DNA-T family DNA segregation ATPase FtsK/SpoIIIE
VAAYPGPVVTRYEIEPATGVKGSQIVNLAKDLARSLSLVSIRVVETIPGKNYMALELPNQRRQTVRLSEILGSEVYNDRVVAADAGLGKDIGGKPVWPISPRCRTCWSPAPPAPASRWASTR